ncbi:MAG: hypothetical protein U1D30_25395 [Planctomycetota bacterium]
MAANTTGRGGICDGEIRDGDVGRHDEKGANNARAVNRVAVTRNDDIRGDRGDYIGEAGEIDCAGNIDCAVVDLQCIDELSYVGNVGCEYRL